MTYLAKPRRRAQSPKQGIGGLLDAIFLPYNVATYDASSETAVCLEKALQASAPTDAKITKLARDWNPTGFFTPDQVERLVAATQEVMNQALANIRQQLAGGNDPASKDHLNDAITTIHRQMSEAYGSPMVPYIRAAAAARSGGGVVDAPGLKKWVVDALNAASTANNTAYVIGCQRPWWVTAIAKIKAAIEFVVNLAFTIAGIAWDAIKAAGTAVVKVVEYWTYIKWGLIVGGGLFAAYKIRNAIASRT